MVCQDIVSNLSKNKKVDVWTVSGNDAVITESDLYSYERAIKLAGNGRYNYCLLATLSLSLLAMSLDMFGFAIVVTLSSCQFQLDHKKKSILVSMPFIGSIIMAYAWGYIADTRGRRKCLLVAMTVSYIVSTLAAFSPHWIVLAVCRLTSTCFCSCAQSVSFSLLGESLGKKVSGTYMLIMTSMIHAHLSVNYALAYFIGNLSFSIDLGLIIFVPWRLLTIVLALPLGICALSLVYCYESPKFLLNAGREEEALEVLKKICARNGGDPDQYPVTCVTGIDSPIVIAAVIASTIFSILNALISRLASRKKLLLIVIYLVSAASGAATVIIPSNHASVIFYFGILLNNLSMGHIASYLVELYPTSFRGMASCLGVMVARMSSVTGINSLGPYIRSHCSFTFFGLSALMLSAAIVSYFLPPDSPKQAALIKENVEDVKETNKNYS